ncbi:crosslink repair DNA glycosylase YcaQ family protein [Gemmatimonas sp.]|uniref:DNA glycosylase AlkZ-like family protein n=1 Tax=Gemmatimonas sp. TaxID=1962908 RepID=UPI00286BFA9A|nr:crosslink repair DNA glycosylase YcaQ family protein [Gemmatimonas sp.]
MPPDIDRLRQFALRRQLPQPTTLGRAIARLGFVQADPIRAPARAQDLTLRHRVTRYRAGELEQRYGTLGIEEDFFVNYGFVTRDLQVLMHPRTPRTAWSTAERRRANNILAFVRESGVVHPRDVDAQFSHGKALNWFGGQSNVSTQLLDAMHYRGLVRVARREGGTRLYAVREQTPVPADSVVAMDALVDVIVAKYAPLTGRMLSGLVQRLRYGAPQWTSARAVAVARAKRRLPHATVDGQTWFWPDDEALPLRRVVPRDTVRLLAPFDPFVWDRTRFEQFNGWAYRFEAYTPAPKRIRGYYALPLAWRDRVIGWANLSVRDGRLVPDLGFVAGRAPNDTVFRDALDEELAAFASFMKL